ncbi:MAG: hypothetical protein Q4C25_02030 [Bacillota bacterium]|nr:hypothetical protein [Bacillota bacterium]
MKKMKKKFALLTALLFVLVTALCSCGSSIDPVAIVKSNLDAAYKGEFNEDMAEYFTDLTSQEDVDAYHEELVQEYIANYLTYFDVDEAARTDEFMADVRMIVEEMMAHAKYTLSDGGKTDTNYNVIVTIEPVNLYYLVQEDWDTMDDAFDARNDNYEFSGYSDEQFQAAYDQAILDFVKSKLPEMGHMEAEEYTVRVALETDEEADVWCNDNDIQNVCVNMIWD